MFMFYFSAIVGQEDAKLALMLGLVNRDIGGVLLSGVKGTGKSTLVRGLSGIIPEIEIIEGCDFNCTPENPCEACRKKDKAGTVNKKVDIVTVPIGTSQDRLLGSIDMDRALRGEGISYSPGLLARANNQVLYIDEVNLLPDHITDNILDAAASGMASVEREGISITHPAHFTLTGTMNPEEGQLRPQILDRFALSANIETLKDTAKRAEIIKRVMAASQNPKGFAKVFSEADELLKNKIVSARNSLSDIRIGSHIIDSIAQAMADLELDGQRADIVILRAGIALCALEGDKVLTKEHIQRVAPLAVCHRTRKGGMEDPPTKEELESALSKSFNNSQSSSKAVVLGDMAQSVLDSALASIEKTDSKKN